MIGISDALRQLDPTLKVYLSVPMIANRALKRANVMAMAIKDAGHNVSSPWVLGPIENPNPNITNVFQRDLTGSESSDILVADVSQPSIGVGMEIMAAYKAGKRIILVSRKGNPTSRMLQHMEKKETIEFEKEDEIYPALVKALKK
jgi:hypothetical protein